MRKLVASILIAMIVGGTSAYAYDENAYVVAKPDGIYYHADGHVWKSVDAGFNWEMIE